MQIQIPHHIPSRSKLSSYKIPNLHIKVAQFKSVKSKILRDEYLKKVKALKEAKLKRKRKEAEEMKKNNPALEFDEYYFYDSQEEMYLKDLPEEYIPPDPNPILFTIPMKRATDPPSTPEDIVWLSVDGYDAGYLYGISMDKPEEDEEENEPDIIPLPGMVDVAATCALKVPNSNHLYLGFGNGIIRLVQIDPNAPNHTGTYLQISTHDHQYGRINKLCMSPDQSHLYSCGDDSNIFSYRINDPARQTVVKDLDVELPEDIEKSLEEEKQKIRYGNRMAEANRAKQNLRNVLATLQNQLGLILRRLNDIPESIRPSDEDFELDPRITEATIRMAKEPLELIKTKMRYDIEKSKFGFEKLYNYFLRDVDCFYKYVFDTKCERYVTTFVQKKMKQDLESELYNLLMEIESETSVCFKIPEEIKNTRAPSKEDVKESPEIDQRKPSFLKDLESFKHKLPLRTQRALRKYYEGREEIDTQKLSLEEFEKLKPDMGNNHEEEEKPDENADKTVGNYTMKCDPEYRVPKDKRSSVKTKKLQILKTESEIHNLKQQFNQKVLDLLQEKVDLIQEMKQLTHDLKQRQVFIPKKFHQHFPSIPCLNYDLEFPERKFQVDQTTFPDQYEPRNLWTCPELDLLRPPEIIVSPFSEEPSSLNLPDTMSQLNEEENEASQTVFKIHGGEKPSEVPCELPSCATFRMPSVLSHPGLDHLESDVHRSHMFLTTPEISMATLELPSGSSDISTLDLSDLSAISSDMSISDMIDMFKQDQEQSPLEMELAKDTTIRLILEQASIANDLAKRKENFNKKVERLALERFRTAESIKLLELFLLTLNQELIVLDSFKGGENAIQVVIDEQVAAIQSKQAKIIEMGKQIEENDAKILLLKEKIKGIEATFAAFNQNCPKYALLYFKKVFQKKLKIRIPKPDKEEAARKITETGSPSSPKKYVEDKDDRSDYTTSSEEEEEEGRDVQAEVGEEGGDGGDDEDGDVWDENSQPPGLNPKMHETVVQLRLRRHEVEEEIAAIMNKNDALAKEIEHVTNSITYIKSNMVIRNEELDEIITEKQKKLNEVETTIVLKVSQLKNEDSPLNRCIILPSTQFYWLNNRSYELKKETEAERKQFHECDKTLSKIKSENARLQEQYKKLLGQVNEATIKKYGRLVNVTELEEAVLQALIHEVRMDVPDIIKSLDSDLKRKQTKLEEEEIALLELMKNRNETFQFLATLEAEQLHLEREIAIINSKKKLENNKHKSSQSNYNQDIAKLCGMYDRLKREEVLIMTELCDLTYKGTRPPVKLPPMRKEIKIVKTKPKDTPADRATELKNASKKIKEILEAINSQKLDTDDFSFIVDDLKKLYGLNIKGTENETVDDVVDVMIDLATKKEDSNIGVSNAEVIKATLSMLLLDIEQTESQLNKKDEGHDDAMSVLSDVSGIEEDIIKVSVQPDEGDRVTEVGESSVEEDEDIVRSDIESETKTDDVKDDVEATADLEQEEDIIEDEDVTIDNENENIDDA
ncbi:hypothetical protein M8J76_004627 [Diaphorina citri]|nr:hypothetical protein M8J76_004627 [Diaphorina citri]